MSVEVLFFGRLRELAVRQQVVSLTEGARLTDLIECLVREHGAEFSDEISHTERLSILINGRHYGPLGGTETLLKDGDVVAFLPPITGG